MSELFSNGVYHVIFTKMPSLQKRFFPSGAALSVNIVLDDITSRLEIKCTNSGCEWVGKLVNYSQHCNTCAKLLVECLNRGCMEKKPREEMRRHISQCEKQELPCRDCGKRVTRDSMREHSESLCSQKESPVRLAAEQICHGKAFIHSFIYI